jgi:hypothetical protein
MVKAKLSPQMKAALKAMGRAYREIYGAWPMPFADRELFQSAVRAAQEVGDEERRHGGEDAKS